MRYRPLAVPANLARDMAGIRPCLIWPNRLANPRTTGFRQAVVRIVDTNRMRWRIRPGPKDEIGRAGPRADGKAGDKQSGRLVTQPVVEAPRRGSPAFGEVEEPRTSHRFEVDAGAPAIVVRRQVDNIVAIDFIGAKCQRIELVGKAARRFLHGAFRRGRKIERRDAFGIEAAAVNGGAVSRDWREGPFRIVAAIGQTGIFQAKPPSAR